MRGGTVEQVGNEATASRSFSEAIASTLAEMQDVLRTLPVESYGRRMGPMFLDATIGGHVRHCLDHVRALTQGWPVGLIDYDHRERGTVIESDPQAAVACIVELLAGLRAVAACDPSTSLSVSIMPARDGRAASIASTLARELAFVLSHTIHHNATIRGMLVCAGYRVPESFGYAPSTLAHKDKAACAR